MKYKYKNQKLIKLYNLRFKLYSFPLFEKFISSKSIYKIAIGTPVPNLGFKFPFFSQRKQDFFRMEQNNNLRQDFCARRHGSHSRQPRPCLKNLGGSPKGALTGQRWSNFELQKRVMAVVDL